MDSKYRGSTSTFSQINVTPLTDVFLVLLVIMILIVPLTSKAALKVNMSGDGSGEKNGEVTTLVADVFANGSIMLNGRSISPTRCENIQKAIESEKKRLGAKNLQLELSSDPLATQKDVVAVMDAAVGAGITQVSITHLKEH